MLYNIYYNIMSEKKRKRGNPIGVKPNSYKCSKCRQSCDKNPSQFIINDISKIGKEIQCINCPFAWILCTKCQIRFPNRNRNKAIAHFKEHHPETLNHYINIDYGRGEQNTRQTDTNIDFMSAFNTSSSSSSSSTCPRSLKSSAQDPDISTSKLSESSKFYFNNVINHDRYGGIQALCS